MAMGKRSRRQDELFITHEQMPQTSGHPFYEQVNRLLDHFGFDAWLEERCAPFYHGSLGRPSLAPGVYFRCLLIGFFEGIDSERGIAWRVADSLSLRDFLGLSLTETTPDHSTISRTRRRIDLETHEAVFTWMLKVLTQANLLDGKIIGIDATTQEANAAMRSLQRRDTGESHEQFLTRLAKESGIETPTREDLARIDKQRKKGGKGKSSNDDWGSPTDPDAKVTKMKDGSTHLAHKVEHAVDMTTGAVLGVTIQAANLGDTTTYEDTLNHACEQMEKLNGDPDTSDHVSDEPCTQMVADKGYHSDAVLENTADRGIRTYIAVPDPPGGRRRKWQGKGEAGLQAQADYHANKRRVKGCRGRGLMKTRGEKIERSFAHTLDTGGMRRTHLCGHDNIFKRLVVHTAGFNLSLVMRKAFGAGKPRQWQGLAAIRGLLHALILVISAAFQAIRDYLKAIAGIQRHANQNTRIKRAHLRPSPGTSLTTLDGSIPRFATGC